MMFGRAIEQLEGLNKAISAWRELSGHVTIEEVDENVYRTWDRLRGWKDDEFGVHLVFHERYPINLNWALILGECLHSFRCSLDHLVYALSEKHTGVPLPTHVEEGSEFPIHGPKPLGAGTAQKKIGATDPGAQAIIKGLQPHLDADYRLNPLWVLHDLDRRAKHRVIPLIVASGSGAMFDAGPGSSYRGGKITAGPLEDGTVIAEVVVAPDANGKVNVGLETAWDVVVGEAWSPYGSVIDTLARIQNKIATEVAPPLEAFL
jgi:hypothetical protein